MGLLLAAPPFEQFVRENSPTFAIIICVMLALLVVRLVVRNTTRLVLLAGILLVATFVAIERDNITECTQTCKCTLAGFDTSIAYCNPKLPRIGS